ncbi:hypothetical protein [Chelativorans sp. AA-79]|uniref:hypothetical protein n=1 Tax=Chelativorans sp. AA-79 TaxID=3028735 RepID=UPI0023FA1A6D|nr:hypothetical protein [Chelativorans sp. AA-79]WEX10438.1 hypothetical protein PVE73_05630 [Chelativorans sp. AA-79]
MLAFVTSLERLNGSGFLYKEGDPANPSGLFPPALCPPCNRVAVGLDFQQSRHSWKKSDIFRRKALERSRYCLIP